MRRHSRTRPRPPWWPAGEVWPPRRSDDFWHSRRRRFGRVVGLLFAAWLLVGVLGAVGFISTWLQPPVSGMFAHRWAPVVPVAMLLVVAALVFVGAMRHLGGPFSEVVSAADRVGNGDFSARVREAGPPFLRTVARAFNVMTGRLAAQERQRRQLVEDVAHELRTPLAILRGRVEGMIDGVYQPSDGLKDVLDQALTLERLVADLGTLASAEGGSLRLDKAPVDITAIVRDVESSFRDVADDARVRLSIDLSDSELEIEADPIRLREVLINVVANAIHHTPAGGQVTMRARPDGSQVKIEVIDSGRGIAPQDRESIFERFRKGPESRGSGLGLTIARQLVLAHGGTITAASEPGRGTTLTVLLPRH